MLCNRLALASRHLDPEIGFGGQERGIGNDLAPGIREKAVGAAPGELKT
jgi:hypothetical protein